MEIEESLLSFTGLGRVVSMNARCNENAVIKTDE